ncbi:MAG: DNA-directed RNA polymerase subunit omega [Actinobacteria bacterium TMED172]|jgi:DNA-directed RNA polymerase subunit omega|nr:DNA-directed RNA polymerase subunit omega [Acidimicrobiaceae bacterium]MCH2633913.1 DNA-directed RNA polymerase subunit omega [Acidimicrobiales bacterium]OUW32412.1 MAG: DNA-directed RNA polymerase subunit omega [Actinobacteria bacterium TMED172]HBV25054.1 DNA-directed RNA polymerase subunit omega [Acidimicrobiaceae bacterium]HCK74358.1 DNA-directed RNA polymerase subunit omega [Acidimicrobiaceae bacterium]|tara:strand:+ start:4822 stop:5169 length:348 start_codon:yes stop_codon:yes gene_type:complete
MADDQDTMISPGLEALLEKVDSKFTLVSLAAKRSRQLISYDLGLGEGGGSEVPPQVTSTARKSLSMAFEEIQADKIGYERFDPEERAREEAEALAQAEADAAAAAAALEAVPDEE